MIAAAAVTVLVHTLVPNLPAPSELVGAKSAASDVCPADAKKANLDFTVNDMHGKTVALSSFKGKVIVLDFWATWCPPCKAEIPRFVELQDAYGDKGLQVVGSVDDPADKLPPFADEFKMNYPVLVGLGRDDLQDALRADVGIPTTFVINRDGRDLPPNSSGLCGKERYERAYARRSCSNMDPHPMLKGFTTLVSPAAAGSRSVPASRAARSSSWSTTSRPPAMRCTCAICPSTTTARRCAQWHALAEEEEYGEEG